jgi:mannose-1-phosphate guanylyltransferase
MMNNNHYVAIMAGGIGSRFWPMSRTSYPKQFLDILNTGRTLIQSTHDRFKKFIPLENIYVVTSEEYVEIVRDQLPEIPAKNIVAEPSRKNTAPCIAYISYKLQQLNGKGTLICAPADHIILDDTAFTKVCLEAMSFVKAHKALITLGIKPSHPNTGYGYIQFEQQPASDNVYKVKTFTEKPNADLAKTFVSSGEFLWNAGIFVWQVNNIVAAFEKHLPELAEIFEAEKTLFNTEKEKSAIEKIYPLCTNVSIDYAVMEKAENVYIIPSSFGWSDLGTWNSAHENMEKDYLGNAVSGSEVMVIDATHNMVHVPNNKLVLLQGLNDYIIVDTEDVLMICKKEKEQEIKQYVAEIKRNKGDKYL